MTNYSRLLEDRRIEREPGVRGQVAQQLSSARRDLKTARKLLADEDEWAYAIAYHAMLSAGRAAMFPRDTDRRAQVATFRDRVPTYLVGLLVN